MADMYGAMAQGAGSLAVLAGGLLSAFGGKGGPPAPKPVDVGTALQSGVTGNLAALPGAQKLVTQTNAFNQDQVNTMLRKAIPEYDQLMKEQLDVINPMLKGELPEGVKGELQRNAAAYGVSSGTGGSQFAGYRGLRNLGLSSLQYATQGLTSAENWLKTAYTMTKAPVFDVSRMFITGPEALQQADWEANRQYDWQIQDWKQPTGMEKIGMALAAAGGTLAGVGGTGALSRWSTAPNVGAAGIPMGSMGTGETATEGYGMPSMGAGDWAGEAGAATMF